MERWFWMLYLAVMVERACGGDRAKYYIFLVIVTIQFLSGDGRRGNEISTVDEGHGFGGHTATILRLMWGRGHSICFCSECLRFECETHFAGERGWVPKMVQILSDNSFFQNKTVQGQCATSCSKINRFTCDIIIFTGNIWTAMDVVGI